MSWQFADTPWQFADTPWQFSDTQWLFADMPICFWKGTNKGGLPKPCSFLLERRL